jgi:hypothetical protein
MLEFPKFSPCQGCSLGNMQGTTEGRTPMQATLYGLSKQGNIADCPENNLGKVKIWETIANALYL